MHYHLHLIPRAEDAEALTLTAWEMIPGDMDVINRTGAAIAAAAAQTRIPVTQASHRGPAIRSS